MSYNLPPGSDEEYEMFVEGNSPFHYACRDSLVEQMRSWQMAADPRDEGEEDGGGEIDAMVSRAKEGDRRL